MFASFVSNAVYVSLCGCATFLGFQRKNHSKKKNDRQTIKFYFCKMFNRKTVIASATSSVFLPFALPGSCVGVYRLACIGEHLLTLFVWLNCFKLLHICCKHKVMMLLLLIGTSI